jgi:hypothetical protein
MRRIMLILWVMVVSGCADHSSTRQERHARTAQWFKDWMWKTTDSSDLESEIDKRITDDKQGTIRMLNSWIEKRGDQPP